MLVMEPFEKFEAWKACNELALDVYRMTGAFPAEERFGLTSQLRRASFSSAVNIAEGSAKRGPREFRRFIDIALGSLAEVIYTLRFARDVGLLDQDQWINAAALQKRASILTWKLYQTLK